MLICHIRAHLSFFFLFVPCGDLIRVPYSISFLSVCLKGMIMNNFCRWSLSGAALILCILSILSPTPNSWELDHSEVLPAHIRLAHHIYMYIYNDEFKAIGCWSEGWSCSSDVSLGSRCHVSNRSRGVALLNALSREDTRHAKMGQCVSYSGVVSTAAVVSFILSD